MTKDQAAATILDYIANTREGDLPHILVQTPEGFYSLGTLAAVARGAADPGPEGWPPGTQS